MTKPTLRFALITGLFFGAASVDVSPTGVEVAAASAPDAPAETES